MGASDCPHCPIGYATGITRHTVPYILITNQTVPHTICKAHHFMPHTRSTANHAGSNKTHITSHIVPHTILLTFIPLSKQV